PSRGTARTQGTRAPGPRRRAPQDKGAGAGRPGGAARRRLPAGSLRQLRAGPRERQSGCREGGGIEGGDLDQPTVLDPRYVQGGSPELLLTPGADIVGGSRLARCAGRDQSERKG